VGLERVFRGIQIMRESSGYQLILEEGRVEGRVDGVRSMLLHQGRIKFGKPTKATTAALEAITDLRRLQRIGERLLAASSWQDLLETP
jgi:hypothetical protein